MPSCTPVSWHHNVLAHGITIPQLQDFEIPFFELREISVSPFLQSVEVPLDGSKTLWRISHFPVLNQYKNLLRVHSVPSSRSLLKKLNSIGPTSKFWGTSLVTGLQPDFVSLIITLQAWSFRLFLIHFTVNFYIHLYFASFSMIMSQVTVSKTLLKSW